MRLQPGQPRLFQSPVVIIVEIVVADDFIAALQKAQGQRRADKAGAAGICWDRIPFQYVR